MLQVIDPPPGRPTVTLVIKIFTHVVRLSVSIFTNLNNFTVCWLWDRPSALLLTPNSFLIHLPPTVTASVGIIISHIVSPSLTNFHLEIMFTTLVTVKLAEWIIDDYYFGFCNIAYFFLICFVNFHYTKLFYRLSFFFIQFLHFLLSCLSSVICGSSLLS